MEATGDVLQFQWQKNGTNIQDSRYCGTNTDTLHILMVEKGDEGYYRCFMKNDIGRKFSNNVFLTVSEFVLTTSYY